MKYILSRDFHVLLGLAVLVVVPFALAIGVPAEIYFPLVAEDGLFEWLGAIAFFAASLLFAKLLIWQHRNQKNFGLRALWLSALTLMCFLAAGEEISWGQRVFGFDTPTVIAESNVQGEMNLHNLQIFDGRITEDGDIRKEGFAKWLTFGRVAKLIWMGFLIALPIAYCSSHTMRRLVNRVQMPVPPLSVAVAGIVCYVSSRLLFDHGAAFTDDEFLVRISANEIKETIVAFLFLFSANMLYGERVDQMRIRCIVD